MPTPVGESGSLPKNSSGMSRHRGLDDWRTHVHDTTDGDPGNFNSDCL